MIFKGVFLAVVRAKVYLPWLRCCKITDSNWPEPGREFGRVSAWVSV